MSVVIPSRGVAAAAAFHDSRGYLPPLVGVEHGLLVSAEEERPGSGSESSSIGVNEESSLSLSSSSSSKDEKDGEVQSKLRENPLGCLVSLEDSLPIKRGLSNFFNGKSKSFHSLSEAAESGDLVKKESPFNKKRRILTACKSSWRRRASCTSLISTSSMQGFLYSLEETQKEEEEEEDENEEEPKRSLPLPLKDRRIRSFRSPRCFYIGDLQQHINQINKTKN